MEFLARLIGRERKLRPALMQALRAAGMAGDASYDPALVEQLKAGHQELARIFTAVKAAAAECRFQELPELLASFKLAFQAHVMLENVKLYPYVQERYATAPGLLNFVSEARKEMDDISRAVVKFVNAYTETVPTLETAASFKADLNKIGNLLLWRVRLEEGRLFFLYQPDDAEAGP